MRVVIAPDSFGGTLSGPAAAAAIEEGWRQQRPDDDVRVLAMSDGGEGLLDALLAGSMRGAEVRTREVAGPRGLAATARWLLDGDTAVIESAEACGLAQLAEDRRDPRHTTTWGVGQLLDAARAAGARRLLVGLGGSATVDGGTGALSALGFRVTVADGSGLKIGGEDLPRVAGVRRTWVADWWAHEVVLLADTDAPLSTAAATFGPQKGAGPADVTHLDEGLAAWRAVLERDLDAAPSLADVAGSGAAGGLGYGLAAALDAELTSGARAVARLQGLDAALADADLVVTGEGRLDATSLLGKVVGTVLDRAAADGVPVAVVAGQVDADVPGPVLVEEAAPSGPGEGPSQDVTTAAMRLAGRWEPGRR